jgi:peroxiredoxin/mono/diheme cytochrome c family protein
VDEEDCSMPIRRLSLLLLGGLVALAPARPAGPPPRKAPPAGRTVSGFRLEDPRTGKAVALADFKDKKAVAVVFLGTECPVNNAFLPELARLHREYAPKGVQFVGVNPNRQDTAAKVAAHARKHELPFPVLKDPGNKVADLFGAKRTPEAFVLGQAGKVLYQGRIDDQFGVGYKRAGKPTRRDLAAALDEVLAGGPVSVPATPVAGCLIARAREPKADGAVTYTKHVSRILQKNCQECHRPGQIGPMSLLSYDDAVSWADMIREVVSEGRMPPWYADPKHGKWANDRRLAKAERDALLAWLDGGTPRGDAKDAPPPREFPEGWVIGKPDVVLKLPAPITVPAEAPKGGVPYRYLSVPTNFTEDKWVERAEARPGAPEVVHHILVFIVPPGQRFRPEHPGAVLVGMAPGEMPLLLKPGQAKKVPAGARLIFQMHYTPNGKEQRDQSSIGLIFAKKPPRHRVLTNPIHDPWFMGRWKRIPAGAENHRMECGHTFKQDVRVLDFMPHMHLRGKDFLYEAVFPDGRREVLLSVPRYNFNWQGLYRAAEPIRLPKGTRLRCVAHFDNSAKNPHNPDPKKSVTWGDQTWEEMMVGWIDYYVDDGKD